MFDQGNLKYQYSIEVAREIYRNIESDEQAIKVCHNAIENYFKDRDWNFEISEKSTNTFDAEFFKSEEQIVTFTKSNGKPSTIMLNKYDEGTPAIIGEAYIQKSIFGLPVFNIVIMTDSNRVFLGLMSRSIYLSLDTPEAQLLRYRMNALDDIISKYGDDD